MSNLAINPKTGNPYTQQEARDHLRRLHGVEIKGELELIITNDIPEQRFTLILGADGKVAVIPVTTAETLKIHRAGGSDFLEADADEFAFNWNRNLWRKPLRFVPWGYRMIVAFA